MQYNIMKLIQLDRQQWVSQWLRPLIVITMIMCLNLSLVSLVRAFNPAWSGNTLLAGMLLTTLEALYSRRILISQHHHQDLFYLARYHLVEWGMLIMALKLIQLLSYPTQLLRELQLVWQEPAEAINFEFSMMLTLGLLAWVITRQTLSNFDNLQDPNESGLAMEELSQNFFLGGALILLISGLTQLLLVWQLNYATIQAQIFNLKRPHVEGIILNVLVYFILGLVLLSQVNLTRLLIRWQRQEIEVAPQLISQWIKYSFAFLSVLALFAFMLPTNYTLGFLASAGRVIAFILAIINFILELLLFLITLPILWLLHQLLGTALNADTPMPTPPPSPIDSTAMQTPSFWLELLQSVGFWLVMLIIIFYLVKTYLNDHPELMQLLKSIRLFNLLQNIISRLRQLLRQVWGYGASWRPKKLNLSPLFQAHDVSTHKRNWLGHGDSPRDQILHYYRDLLQQLEHFSYRRRQDHTPYEYEPQLRQAMPEVETEVHALTAAFVQARYSQADFTPDQAASAKQQWQLIRSSAEHEEVTTNEEKNE